MRNRSRISAGTAVALLTGYCPRLAKSTAFLSSSVANTLSRWVSGRLASRNMVSVYAPSPVSQPGTQTRTTESVTVDAR